MSYIYVSDTLRGCLGIDPSRKLVLVVLAEHANQDSGGVAWPSVATVARKACLSERQVQAHLRELTRTGWITPSGSARGGRGNTTVYKLNIARMRAVQQHNGEAGNISSENGKGEIHSTVSAQEKVKPNAEKGDAQRHERVKPTAPEPEVNLKEPETAARRSNFAEEGTGTGRSIDKLLTPEPEGQAPQMNPFRTPEALAGLQRALDVVKSWQAEPRGGQTTAKSGHQ